MQKVKEFRIKANFKKTFGRIFAISLPSFLLFVWGSIAMFLHKLSPSQKDADDLYSKLPPLPSWEDLFIYSSIIILISLIFSSLFTYYKYRSKTIEFFESFIKINNKSYLLKNLTLITRPSDEMLSYGQDYIVLEFSDHKKLKFSKSMPRYPEIHRFLKKYLYDRIDYDKLLNGAEF